MLKTAVLISGRGTNLQSIIDAWRNKQLDIDFQLVVSNKKEAYGLKRAKKAAIPTCTLPHTDYQSREDFESALDGLLRSMEIELIALAGFMRILTPSFIKKWEGKIINIHPSLLPAFPGLHTHKRALQAGVKYSGCTIFYVNEGVDTGKIIDQAVVPVYEIDTEDTLAARVLEQEHLLFPKAIQQIAIIKNKS